MSQRPVRCPKCGVQAAEGDRFCEADGTRLVEVSETAPAPPSPGACPGCGASGTGAEDGYCNHCGYKLTAPPGADLSDLAWEALGARLPEVRAGSEATDLAGAARGATLAAGLEWVQTALQVAGVLEAAGLCWMPLGDDFAASADGALRLRAVRCQRRIEGAERGDEKPVLEALGTGLLPGLRTRAPPRLVRLLARAPAPHLPVGLEEARRELASARTELELPPGPAPGVGLSTDPGLRHARNEDAAEAWREGHRAALVVCDGVSSSALADQASRLAASTAAAALRRFARTGGDPERAMADAIHEAHEALVTLSPPAGTRQDPPGTTLVAALIEPGRVTLGWVGDSRAYWVGPGGEGLLSRDHSWVNEVVDRGELSEEEALRSTDAHALTRCLGPLEGEAPTPGIRRFTPPAGARIILCTDGLWNYCPQPERLAGLVRGLPGASLQALSRALVNHGLCSGGHDNVTAAVVEALPPEPAG